MPPSATDAFNALQAYQPPSSADVLTQAESQYGVPQLQTQVNNLRTLTGNLTNSIAAVDPSVTGRTAGTLTTEAQRSALVNREQAPIVSQLGTATTGLNDANQQYATAETNAKDKATATNADNQAKRQALLDTYNIANAREAAAAAAKQQADAQAEAVREYNQSRADANANNSANRAASSGGKAPSAQDTKTAVANHVVSQFNSLKGKDGKVSEETWANALNDWTATGGTVRQFWQNYGSYVNNKYISTYSGYKAR